ncbi:MAG: hypothetical protein R3F49_16205 [Planctomycetota bacterium]
MNAPDMSMVTDSSFAARSGPRASKNARSVSALLPLPVHTTVPRSWSTTVVMYSWCLR